MYNRLSFEDQLSQKYLNRKILQIQSRKSLYPEIKQKVRKKRTTTSVLTEKEIQQNNRKLLEKLFEVKYNPAYVKKMYMGGEQVLGKKSKSAFFRGHKTIEKGYSVKMREIEEQNKRLKGKIESIRGQNGILRLPPL